MASQQLFLNVKCLARLPALNINPHITADDVRKDFTLPLLVHILASERLRQDTDNFIERWPYKQEELVTQFVISIRHHIVILLDPALATFTEALRDHRGMMASDRYLDGRIPTIGDLLDQASDSLSALSGSWRIMSDMLGHDYPVSPGSVVPTVAPRQLLIYLLVNKPDMLQKVATGGEAFLGDIGRNLCLPSVLEIKNNKRHIMPKKRTANGSPRMFFVCRHPANGHRELFVGASQENWTGLPSIGKIRREDRDLRLRSYIPLASRAFDALRQIEENAVLPASMANLPKKEKAYQVRLRAVSNMRNSPHPDFLGRSTEVGQAFDLAMNAHQCCYACMGMMGYRLAHRFPQHKVEENFRDFSWQNRKDYSHSCAEIEVSLQCSRDWAGKGKDAKY